MRHLFWLRVSVGYYSVSGTRSRTMCTGGETPPTRQLPTRPTLMPQETPRTRQLPMRPILMHQETRRTRQLPMRPILMHQETPPTRQLPTRPILMHQETPPTRQLPTRPILVPQETPPTRQLQLPHLTVTIQTLATSLTWHPHTRQRDAPWFGRRAHMRRKEKQPQALSVRIRTLVALFFPSAPGKALSPRPWQASRTG